jgi:hypothetical protein
MKNDLRFRNLYRLLDDHQLSWLSTELRLYQMYGKGDQQNYEHYPGWSEMDLNWEDARFHELAIHQLVSENEQESQSFTNCIFYIKERMSDIAYCLEESEKIAKELGADGVQLGVDAPNGQDSLALQLRGLVKLIDEMKFYD